MKRIIRALTAISIILSIMVFSSISAFANFGEFTRSGDFMYEHLDENEKTARIHYYYGSESAVVIPSQIDGYTIHDVWLGYDSGDSTNYLITELTLPETVGGFDIDLPNLIKLTILNNNPDDYIGIEDSFLSSLDNENFIICGYKDSPAETFAKKNGYIFEEYVEPKNDEDESESNTTDNTTESKTETPAVNVTENGVTVKAQANVFPVGTEIKVEKIETAEEISKIEKTLSGNISNLLCFNISAKADGKTVQPNGKVSVTFEIPDGYNIESLLFYYIPEDGKPEEIKIVKDVKNRTVTAELSHFSTYVMGEKVILIPKTGEINAAAGAVFLAVLSLCGLVFFKKSFYTPRHLLKNR